MSTGPSQSQTQPIYQDNIVYDYFFPFVGKSFKKILPVVVGGALAYGAYLGLDYFRGEDVKIGELEGKTYVTIASTSIGLDGRIGKTLDQLENEDIEDEIRTYNIEKEKVESRYNAVIGSTENEAREKLELAKPEPVVEKTDYLQNLENLRQGRKMRKGEK